MQGKITLEDHFATTTTLGDSQIFGAHVWSELGPRLLDFQDKRLRLMDAAGVEIMIASLNAPAIQAIPDAKRATEVAREANDVLAQEIAKRPDRFVGVAALAMQDPDSADGGARPLRRAARLQRRAGQRVLASGVGRHRGVLRSATISAVLARGRATRRSILSASAQSVAGLGPRLRGPRLAARAELGVRCRDRGARAAADRQRPVRRNARVCRSFSAISARDCPTISGASTTGIHG